MAFLLSVITMHVKSRGILLARLGKTFSVDPRFLQHKCCALIVVFLIDIGKMGIFEKESYKEGREEWRRGRSRERSNDKGVFTRLPVYESP